MTLRDEMPSNTATSFCGVKVSENDDLARQVAEFVKRGGKIEVVADGAGKDNAAFNKGADNQKQAEIQEGFARERKAAELARKKEISEAENKAKRKGKPKPVMRPENRAKSGRMNIHETARGTFVVTIKSMHVGTYNDEPAAIKARDDERSRLKLPEAAY